MKLCDKITKLRKRKGYTQEELASIMEVSRQSVFKWESGENTPDLEKIRKLTKVFNVSFDELLDDDRELGEVSEVAPRQQIRKNTPLIIVVSAIVVVAIATGSFFIGRATKKSAPIAPTINPVESSEIEVESSAEPTTEELTRGITLDDLVGKWKAGKYIWTIQNINGSVMLTSIYDWYLDVTDAPEIKDEYIKPSTLTGYNEVSGLMECNLFHYTGTSADDWYPISISKDKTGVSFHYKNLTFVIQ